MSDSRIERERTLAMEAAIDRLNEAPGEGSLSCLVQTFTETTYPTVKNSFFAVHPVEISGDTNEGATPTLSADTTRKFSAYNLGGTLPPSGTYVIAHLRSGRWTFSYG